MYKLINDNNLNYIPEREADIIFSDYVYESNDFSFITHFWNYLKQGGVYIAMTDFHTIFELGCFMKSLPNSYLVSHLVWKNEWGNHPKDRFHQCFDDIVIFSKGKHDHFYSDRIQIDKVTKNVKLNPSGRETKTATAFITDICLTTTSKERIKQGDHLIRWQKPVSLIQRLCDPFCDVGDLVIDTHMGSGTVGEWCLRNGRDYVGIEHDKGVFGLAAQRLQAIGG